MAFAVTLVLLVFVGGRLRVPLDAFTVTWDRVRELPDLEKDAWYVAYDDFHVDHYILFHGFGEPIRQARAADVIIVGSSRAQFAFPRDVLEQMSHESGLHFYNLQALTDPDDSGDPVQRFVHRFMSWYYGIKFTYREPGS